jgi:FMN phosphatase YigB (HAD superfamily)
MLQEKGLRIILATNPLFPACATIRRIQWAGMRPENFEIITTYENSRFSKPNLKYYQAIMEQPGVKAEECLMVGNDVGEDMIAAKLGLKVFLLTDCLINKDDADITRWPHGGFDDLMEYLRSETGQC